jgi:two-component system, cell cycle response regulator DivK
MATILVVEDNEDNRTIFTAMLEMNGHNVITAINGVEGLKLAETSNPDLILMDLAMPQLDGWRATTILKEHPKMRHIPIIAVTAHATTDESQRILKAGCDGVLLKPVEYEELTRMVDEHLPA